MTFNTFSHRSGFVIDLVSQAGNAANQHLTLLGVVSAGLSKPSTYGVREYAV